MKTVIHFWIFLALALLPAQGQGILSLAGSPPAAGGGGPSFLINEGFEGAGTPSGWYVSGADFDYAASPLIGSQSVRLTANAQYIGIADGGALNHGGLYGKFRFKAATLPSGSFTSVLNVQDSGAGTVFSFALQPSGVIAGPNGDTTDAMTAGTAYWVYWRYLKGTGGNGVAEVGFSTTETRPTSGNKFSGVTNYTSTTNATQLQIYQTNGAVMVFDQFQIATTAFD